MHHPDPYKTTTSLHIPPLLLLKPFLLAIYHTFSPDTSFLPINQATLQCPIPIPIPIPIPF
jgi:hypothetical protein